MYWDESEKRLQAALDLMVEKFKVLPDRVLIPERGAFERELEDKLEKRLVELGVDADLHTDLAKNLGEKYVDMMVHDQKFMESVADMEPAELASFLGFRFTFHFLRCIGIEEAPEILKMLADEVVYKRILGTEKEGE